MSSLLQCLIGVVVWMRPVWVTKMAKVFLPLMFTCLYHLLLGNLVCKYLLKCHWHLLFIQRHRCISCWYMVIRCRMFKQHQLYRGCLKYQLLKGLVCKHLVCNYYRCLVSHYLLLLLEWLRLWYLPYKHQWLLLCNKLCQFLRLPLSKISILLWHKCQLT